MNSAHEDKKIPAKLHTWGPGRLVNIVCSWRCRAKGSCSGGVWTAFSWKPLINTHRAHRSAVRSGGGSPCVVSSVPLCYSRPWLQAWQFSGVAPASSLLHGVNVFWAVCSLINAPRKLEPRGFQTEEDIVLLRVYVSFYEKRRADAKLGRKKYN